MNEEILNKNISIELSVKQIMLIYAMLGRSNNEIDEKIMKERYNLEMEHDFGYNLFLQIEDILDDYDITCN